MTTESFATDGDTRAGGTPSPASGPRRAPSLPTWARREMTNLIVANGQLRDQNERLTAALERLRDSARSPIRVRRWADDVLRDAADVDGR